jgi:Skp family chaperone for outer membrane proteins
MSINIDTLRSEREVLKKDFDNLSAIINQVEKDLGTMKSNLNAVFGAIQQVDKLLKLDTESGEKQLLTEKEKSMPASKEKALNLATS